MFNNCIFPEHLTSRTKRNYLLQILLIPVSLVSFNVLPLELHVAFVRVHARVYLHGTQYNRTLDVLRCYFCVMSPLNVYSIGAHSVNTFSICCIRRNSKETCIEIRIIIQLFRFESVLSNGKRFCFPLPPPPVDCA